MIRDKVVVSNFVAQIGARIRYLRLERGLTLWQFAEIAKMHADSITRIELGLSAITMRSLFRIAKALQVLPFDLLNLDTDTSDLGCLLEMMRKQPALVGFCRLFAFGAEFSQEVGKMLHKQYAENSLVVRVGMRIRKLRIEQKLSLRKLGALSGVHPFHVMAVELGQLAATTKTLKGIARGLGLTALDLLNCDSKHDDIGYIIEAMRTRPECVEQIRRMVKPRRRAA